MSSNYWSSQNGECRHTRCREMKTEVLRFRMEIPVCRGVDYQNGKSIAKLRPMDAGTFDTTIRVSCPHSHSFTCTNIGSFNKIIKDLAVTLGYEEGFSSHRLRAFGAQAALNAGKTRVCTYI